MQDQGINQIALAHRSGVGQTTISKIIRCASSATIDTVDALARALRVSVIDLLNENVDPDLAKFQRRLLESASVVDKDGREMLLRVADREAHYAVTRKDQ